MPLTIIKETEVIFLKKWYAPYKLTFLRVFLMPILPNCVMNFLPILCQYYAFSYIHVFSYVSKIIKAATPPPPPLQKSLLSGCSLSSVKDK